MKTKKISLLSMLIVGLGLIPVERVKGQNFTNLHNFGSPASDGQIPGGLIQADGTLYGTTFYGGNLGNYANSGTVFRINPDGTGYTNLYKFTATSTNFTNDDGAHPGGAYVLNSTLAYSNGVLFGTTFGGGRFAGGTIFRINSDGTGFTNLHDFTGNEGAVPNAGLTLSGNTLYGVTTAGGAGNLGTVFKLTSNGADFVVLHEFTETTGDEYTNSDGGQPIGGLLISGNALYGTAQVGGTSGYGTVFAVNTDGTGFTNLHNFATAGDGVNPSGALILSGSTLYGTAYDMVFAINTNGSGYRHVYDFAPASGSYPLLTNAIGISPSGGLILSGTTLYGTASGGGRFGNGTVFSVSTNGSNFVNLYDFSSASGQPNFLTNRDGTIPSGALALSGNTLYGAANAGGDFSYGTVFSLSLPLPPPQLTIRLSGSSVILSWPTNATGFVLQSATNLASPVIWTTIGGQNVVTNPVVGTQKFYRLIK